MWRGGEIFSPIKVPSQNGSDAKSPEKAVAYSGSDHGLYAVFRSQQVTRSRVSVYRTEDAVQSFPVQIIKIGEIGTRNHCHAFGYIRQPIWILVRQRTYQNSIHKREDRDRRSDAQRQDQNGSDGESRVLAQLPY